MVGTVEIERKFHLRAAPSADLLAARDAVALRIEQTYLVATQGNRRLRRTERPDGSVLLQLTEKERIAGFSFREIERTIDAAEYERLLAEADPARRPIRKVRHVVPHGSQNLEIDVFEQPPGLVLLEVELRSVDEPVVLPEWLGDWREVTGHARFYNANLASSGAVVPSY
jgi:CYTH domain-containing protein